MTDNPFYRLTPFIQDYIYRQHWEALRPVQVRAIQAILDTPNHILITSGTATGKTEAAMLPILTELVRNPSSTISVIYIGPLKALINDQFERIQGMLDETHIPVQSWHGDIAQSKKSKFLKNAQGILQITPESLEAMLINRYSELGRLFGDLRFVVIDEIHAFINSDRGRQVICQLQRLARHQTHQVRRIGLSATLGEPETAMQWLAGGTNVPVILIDDKASQREVEIGLESFIVSDDDKDDLKQEDNDGETLPTPTHFPKHTEFDETPIISESAIYEHMYKMCQRVNKTLIFANQRGITEMIVANLRQLAVRNGTPDFYHVHHGSISAALRESAENAMRDPAQKACTAATVTLELGIDIGHLDQVLQINATHSVSSFVQRLGRSGRRNTPARIFFYNQAKAPSSQSALGELIPWNLLQTISTIQLYIEEKWVEPAQIPSLPFSLLYHQTMSTLTATTELMPAQLAQRILTLSSFSSITQDQYRDLLRHLIDIKHLEVMETGSLIIGQEGEKVVNNYRFYATFEDEPAFQVLENSREIGSIQSIPEIGSTIGLAGHTWRILDINLDKRIIQVERARGKVPSSWNGGGVVIHTRILEKIKQILRDKSEYSYLHKRASQQLAMARKLAGDTNLTETQILPLAVDRYLILPWQGTRTFDTQARLLMHAGFKVATEKSPFYLEILSQQTNPSAIKQRFLDIASTPPAPAVLVEDLPGSALQRNKFDKYVPEHLLRQAFISDFLDIKQAISGLREFEVHLKD